MVRVGKILDMKVLKTAFACAVVSTALFVSAAPVTFAAGGLSAISQGLDTAAGTSGLKTASGRTLEQMVGTIINQAMGLLGVLLFAYLLYGGFLWMTSGGDTKGADKAKATITNAIIGLMIIALAYILTDFVLKALIQATTGVTTSG